MKSHSVVLLVPPLSLEDRYGREMKHFGGVSEPLGLAYLAAVLEREGIPVTLIDAAAEQLGLDEIQEQLEDLRPTLVGLSLLTLGWSGNSVAT